MAAWLPVGQTLPELRPVGLDRLARAVGSAGLVGDRGLDRLARAVRGRGLVGDRGHTDPQMAFDPRQPNPVVDNSLTQTVEVPAQAVVVLAVQPIRRLKSRVVPTARLLKGFAVQAVGLLELLTMLSAGLVEFVADPLATLLLMPDDPERGDHQRDKLHYGFGIHTRHASRPRNRRATRNNTISLKCTEMPIMSTPRHRREVSITAGGLVLKAPWGELPVGGSLSVETITVPAEAPQSGVGVEVFDVSRWTNLAE